MNIKRIAIILKNELFAYVINPVFYLAGSMFVCFLATNFFVLNSFFMAEKMSTDIRYFFTVIPYISILLVPALTMSLWHEDFMSTLPFTTTELVVGKWLASVLVFAFYLLVSMLIPLFAAFFAPVDVGKAALSAFLMMLFFSTACALGQLFSLILPNNTVAFLATAAVLAISNSIHLLPLYLSLPPSVATLTNYLSLAWHFNSAAKGIVDSRDLVFFLVTTLFFLFLTVYHSERKKYA